MTDDENEPRFKKNASQTFPRVLEGLSVAAMEEYLGALETERQRVKLEIDKRGGMKSAAEALFKPKTS